MRVIVVGLGVQGVKRKKVAGHECVATVEIRDGEGDYSSIETVPLDIFDGAILCLPDDQKLTSIKYLISKRKHIMVEKPLAFGNRDLIKDVFDEARRAGVILYTAYNHRFEPAFVRMKKLIESGELGNIYSVRMFYGNGTARLVRDSEWRDNGSGVLSDLGSHLLDTINFWFSDFRDDLSLIIENNFENKVSDHAVLLSTKLRPQINLEMTLCMWRNHFTCDVLAENGSAHIESLCKWGPSTFTKRKRVFPSGIPDEERITLVQGDPTWELEYTEFKRLIDSHIILDHMRDLWIDDTLNCLKK